MDYTRALIAVLARDYWREIRAQQWVIHENRALENIEHHLREFEVVLQPITSSDPRLEQFKDFNLS